MILQEMWNFYYSSVLMGFLHLFFPEWFLMKKLTKRTTFEDNMSQNNLLSSHITVSSILLCPTHYCVQHIIVSNKILCPHLPKRVFCSPFTFQCAAVVSCCACEAPLFVDIEQKINIINNFKYTLLLKKFFEFFSIKVVFAGFLWSEWLREEHISLFCILDCNQFHPIKVKFSLYSIWKLN